MNGGRVKMTPHVEQLVRSEEALGQGWKGRLEIIWISLPLD